MVASNSKQSKLAMGFVLLAWGISVWGIVHGEIVNRLSSEVKSGYHRICIANKYLKYTFQDATIESNFKIRREL